MKRTVWTLVVSVALASAGACGGSGIDAAAKEENDFQALLQGNWTTPCWEGGTSSERSVLSFSGVTHTATVYQYANGTCSGAGTTMAFGPMTFTVVGSVTADLGGSPVVASQIDVTDSGAPALTRYHLLHVDTAATPDRLYVGDIRGGNDGSTAAKRPTRLDATHHWLRQ